MNDKQIEERKKYLALQAFYLRVKELLEELERKFKSLPEEKAKHEIGP